MFPCLEAGAALFKTEAQFRAKLGRGTSTRGGLDSIGSTPSRLAPVHSTSSQPDHRLRHAPPHRAFHADEPGTRLLLGSLYQSGVGNFVEPCLEEGHAGSEPLTGRRSLPQAVREVPVRLLSHPVAARGSSFRAQGRRKDLGIPRFDSWREEFEVRPRRLRAANAIRPARRPTFTASEILDCQSAS